MKIIFIFRQLYNRDFFRLYPKRDSPISDTYITRKTKYNPERIQLFPYQSLLESKCIFGIIIVCAPLYLDKFRNRKWNNTLKWYIFTFIFHFILSKNSAKKGTIIKRSKEVAIKEAFFFFFHFSLKNDDTDKEC